MLLIAEVVRTEGGSLVEHSEKLLLKLQSFWRLQRLRVGFWFFLTFSCTFPPKTLDIGQTLAVTRFPLVKGGRSINDI